MTTGLAKWPVPKLVALFVGLMALTAPGIALSDGMRILAPGPATIKRVDRPFLSRCEPARTAYGAEAPCPLVGATEIEVTVEGYVRRSFELRLPVKGDTIDLRDDQWVPTSVRLSLEPVELSTSVTAVWIDDSRPTTSVAFSGALLGPHVLPGHEYSVALVGPETKAMIVSRSRAADAEPITVRLEPGRSVAVACEDPWTGELLTDCDLELGHPLTELAKVGDASVVPGGSVMACGQLHVLDIDAASTILVARAPDLAPKVLSTRDLAPLTTVTLETPHDLEIELLDQESDEPLSGRVRLSRDFGEASLRLATCTIEPERPGHVVLASGDYEAFAEASGYHSVRTSVRVKRLRGQLVIPMEKGVTVQGLVLSDQGQPVEGAMVLASTTSLTFDSMSNLAQTDANGSFELTLPNAGPWSLVAQLEGRASDPVSFSTPPENVTLVLKSRCSVKVLPVFGDGTPIPAKMLTLMKPQSLVAVFATERAPDGSFRAEVNPGEWLAAIEGLGLAGRVTIPTACEGWRGVVIMSSASQ